MEDSYPKLRLYRLFLAPGAVSVNFFRQGATIRETIPTIANGVSADVPVYDAGRLELGDLVRKNGTTPQLGTVDAIISRSLVRVTATGGDLDLEKGDRLVPFQNQPTLYTENSGTDAYPGHQLATDPVTGVLPPVYLKDRFFDVLANEALFVDQPSGASSKSAVLPSQRVFDIRDYGGDVEAIRTALELAEGASPKGGAIFIPAGTYTISSPLHVRGGRITIQGEGYETKLVPADQDTDVVFLEGNAPDEVTDFHLKDIQILGARTPGTGCGISSQGVGARPASLTFEHVEIIGMGQDGVRLENVNFPMFVECSFADCRASGVYMKGVIQPAFYQCFSHANSHYGVYVEKGVTGGANLYFQGVGVEDNAMGLLDTDVASQIRVNECVSVVICASQIEKYVHETAKAGILIESSRGVVVSGCSFVPGAGGASGDPDAVCVKIVGASEAPTVGVQVVGNKFEGNGTGVKVEDSWCIDMLLAQNSASGGLPTQFVMYDYPRGTDAEGTRVIASGGMETGADKSVGATGLLLPASGGSAAFASPVEAEGMIAYHPAAQRGHKLKLAEAHTRWWPVGGAQSYQWGSLPDPTTFAPGTLIWVGDAPADQRLWVVYNEAGVNVWRVVRTEAAPPPP